MPQDYTLIPLKTAFLRKELFLKRLQQIVTVPFRFRVGQFEMVENCGREMIEIDFSI
jgi:hypothetical protein